MEPPETSVARFERHVATAPSRTAVRTPSAEMTYGQLDAHANGIAAALIRSGAEAGRRVALLVDQDPIGCAALIGVLKTGATCVPISAHEPPARIRRIGEDAGVVAVATLATHRDRVSTAAVRGIQIVDIQDAPADATRSFPAPESSHPTVIVYTSGSTGAPKGVIQTNTTNTRRTDTWSRALRITPDDRLTLFATFATGQGISATLLALLSGATLCPFDVRREGASRLTTWLGEAGITVYISSVTLLRSLAELVPPGATYPDLRIVRFGGEASTARDVESFQKRFPSRQLVHGYASTESGVIAYNLIDPTTRYEPDEVVPVGVPHHGIQVHVVADDESDVPPGTLGRIVVRGTGVSPGYWNDTELTERAFAPLASHPDEPAFRIGDIGRLRPDGQLEHHGRRDHRVKIRGFRIELSAVDAALREHPAVIASAVVARPRSNGVELDLVGYVQLGSDATETAETLRAHLASRLPDHMIPSRFVLLDAMPLTASGKLDRAALPDPATVPSPTTSIAPPRSELETSLVAIWKEVLDVDAVGIHDHFLEVGGDSLRATQVAARLQDVLDVDIPMGDLFDAGTIADIAALAERAKSQTDEG